MATVKFKAHKHHKKSDGTINVKLVIYHKGKRVYPDTSHYVTESQLTKKYEIKDKDLIAKLTRELADYREKISSLGSSINYMSAEEVSKHILPDPDLDKPDSIDFIAFGKSRVAELREEGRDSYAGTLRTVVNNFSDFVKSDKFNIQNITSDLLKQYEKYLRSPYIQKRENQFKKIVEVQQPGMEDAGIYAHMKNFRILFNAARDRYNDMDLGIIRIPNYPFQKYKLKEPAPADKRSVRIEVVRLIRDVEVPAGGRAEIGRDMFMLSFYLCGMNAVDIYHLDKVKAGRVDYNRSKTKDKRADSAFFSVKLIPEAKVILDKYLGKLPGKYSTPKTFRKAISDGLKQVSVLADVDPVDFYSARHTVGNEARNTLGYSKSDVAELLNHSQPEFRVTDTYIKRQWTLIDEIQEKLLALLNAV